MTRVLNEPEAEQFALMLLSGAPIRDVVGYFLDENSPEEVTRCRAAETLQRNGLFSLEFKLR